ncbi:MAG: ADP-ribosylglycohydrolase family protein, partial [Planctomycetes bacterium]|nr:ADP-ribosylglycohydrolase family protein [Planctomycetota bacterium]
MHIDLNLLRQEIAQRREEGCDVTAVETALGLATQSGKPLAQAELDGLWAQLQAMEHKLGCPYVEPSDLAGIRAQRPQGIRKQRLGLSDDELFDKTYGAWLGRSAGCQLGKAVEGWTRAKIRDYLTLMREYPLADYFPPPPPDAPPQFRPNVGSCRGKFQSMSRDDDMDYTILGLVMLEKYGLDFKTDDVGTTWQLTMPYQCTYTAERVAYRNLVMGLKPPATALIVNPYREWIGAQIRADAWGYVTPGLPELGAEFAWRDAALSHVKNGIYGEMLVAAMLSASFSTSDVMRVIEIGLSEIPRKSRLAEAVKDTLSCAARFRTWEEAWDDLM